MRYQILVLFLLATNGLSAQVFENGTQQLPQQLAGLNSMDVRAADLDKDGDLDLVLANEFQKNVVLINDGTGRFELWDDVFSNTNKDSEDIALADFNDDGNIDVIFCSEDDQRLGRTNVHEYYLGNGDGTFRVAAVLLPDSEANAVVEAYINDDEYPDLIFGNSGRNFILINNGDGSFENASDSWWDSPVRTTQDVQVADVNGDGLVDIFEGNEDGNVLWINRGDSFENVSEANLPQRPLMETRKVAFADIDGDNDLDLFLANVGFRPGKVNTNAIWLNDGEGVFSVPVKALVPPDFWDSLDGIFEDVDADGDPDLIVANVNLRSSAHQAIYENDGNGQFTEITNQWFPFKAYGDMLGLISEDLNGDKKKDLYFCNRGGMDLLLLRKTGSAVEDPTDAGTVVISGNDSIHIPFPGITHVLILDLQGRPIQRVKCSSGQCQIYQSLPFGYYILVGMIEEEIVYRNKHIFTTKG